jgi:GNAT superfamily N-acetyltransferase
VRQENDRQPNYGFMRADVAAWNKAGRDSTPREPAQADDPVVWASSCFFIRRNARRQGVSHRLVAAGVAHARQSGARHLEACPMDLSKDQRSIGLFVGSTRVFEKAGFERMVERKPGRPRMRLVL